ncbi:hypothetical protein VP1G_02016 [Cytospora mali]|uniref:Uncharacterized protein n=1 Tax=Cytospora mali TaxID=578113 RepID=A0A194USJ4_CYTMA|nr:hypothetical protein VP1G_02016 [Valsa mali var. pyri (nom. inval.)]
MLTSPKLLTAAAAALLLRPASAAPPLLTPALEARAPAATDNVWVTVDTSGTPVTVTPVVSVVDGATTTISAVPNDLTATVITRTKYAEVTTSTGSAAPTATNANGAGSFLVCNNADGVYAPFCQPTQNSSLYTGTTYYVTWDSSVFNSTNTTVVVEGSYINTTTGELSTQAFSSPETAANQSYYAWKVKTKLLPLGDTAVNISLTLRALAADSNDTAASYTGPTVLVTRPPTYLQPAPKMPSGAALYIGLPTVLGFCVVMIFGVCMWNRKERRIDLGDIMSRGRNKYGAAKDRARRRLSRREKKQAIRLDDHGPEGEEEGGMGYRYRDEEPETYQQEHHQQQQHQQQHQQHHDDHQYEDAWAQPEEVCPAWERQQEERRYRGLHDSVHVGVARRDSDALGSLVGTPTSDRFSQSHHYD